MSRIMCAQKGEHKVKTTAISRACFDCLTDRLLEELRRDGDQPPDQEDRCEGCRHNAVQRLELIKRPRQAHTDTEATRVCFSCHVEKSLEEFHRSRDKPLGRSYECRTCSRDRGRGRVHNTPPSDVTMALNRERSRQAYRDCPEAFRARNLVNKLIKAGFITRLPCQYPLCNKEKTDGHHFDYSKPLEVVWLCRSHHWLVERILKGSDEAPMPVFFIHDYSYVESSLPVALGLASTLDPRGQENIIGM